MSSPASSLPDAWVQRIWAGMRATYGAAFDRMWAAPPGADPVQHAQATIAHWAKELGRFQSNPQALAYALDNLPANPPNLIEFKALCNRRPEPKAQALPAPELNKAAASAALAQAGQVTNRIGDHLTPIRALMMRELAGAGHGLTKFQRDFWRKALQREIWARHQIDTSQPFDIDALRAAVQEVAHG